MNIVEILKYCPKGTKLYSLIDGEVTLGKIESPKVVQYPIEVIISDYQTNYYTKDGLYSISHPGECVLFPSKDQRDWSKFRLPVKRGDIMTSINGYCPFIATGELYNGISPKYICGINSCDEFEIFSDEGGWTTDFYIPASEEAKKELFDKMAEAGYKWNTDTLELEKIEPKSKEGNVLIKNGTLFLSTGVIINNVLQVYCLCADGTFMSCGLSPISSLELAPEEYKTYLFSVMTKEGYKYDKEQHKLVKQEFKPFDKVLVRNYNYENWECSLFSHYQNSNETEYIYVTMNGSYIHCIPYKGNEYLLNKIDNPQQNKYDKRTSKRITSYYTSIC